MRSLFPTYRRILSDRGNQGLDRGLWLAALGGVAQGAALVALIPAVTTLAAGGVAWGLSLNGWLAVLVGLGLLGGIVQYANSMATFDAALDLLENTNQYLGDKIASLPLGWFRDGFAGKASRMVSSQMMQVGNFAAHLIGPLMTSFTTCVTLLVGVLLWDWRLGLMLTACVPVVWVCHRLSLHTADRGKAAGHGPERELSARIVELARCQGVLRSNGVTTDLPELRRAVSAVKRGSRIELWWETGGMLLSGIAAQMVTVALIVGVATLTVQGEIPPLTALAFMGVALRFTQILEDFGSKSVGLRVGNAVIKDMADVLDANPTPAPQHRVELSAPGRVELAHVHFSYEPGQPVLDEIDLVVEPGTMCAIVGPSGSGKTTMARLVARFYDVDSGTVRVGGVDVRDQPTEQLMEQLSMVFQDVYLFDDSLAANIRIGRADASEVEVHRVARRAGVTEIVDRLPDGWNARVGEGGRSLSGGERQRVSVARALLKQAPIVLFDEATSALDAENEANIMASVHELRRTATVLVIAHKLETVRAADQIVVLDERGRIVQRGVHDELVAVSGPYQDFWRQRERAAAWTLGAA